MPYPNEHACRLRQPGLFQPNSFRRTSRAHDGKNYSVIMGRLKGETSMTEQAYRYPISGWTEAQARAHCRSHNGISFEPAAPANQSACSRIQSNNANYIIRQESLNGITHIVVPVVMMVEGVHAGSAGPILHVAQELGRFVEAWNGIPVTIRHPQLNNEFTSANQPEVLEMFAVGQIFNAHFEDSKLKAEAWINQARIQQLSQETLNMINNGTPLDVSVGIYTDSIEEGGDWKGEIYNSIATNYRPDHLALLPDEEGACNFQDGCGIRNNNANKKEEKNEKMDLKTYKAEAMKFEPVLQINTDYVETANNIRRILDEMDREGFYHFLEALEANQFYYRIGGSAQPTEYFRQAYSETDGTIAMVGNPVKVTKRTIWEAVQPTTMTRTKVSKKVEPIKTNSKMELSQKIDQLIANTRSLFCESDRDFLLTQSEEKIDGWLALSTEQTPKEEPAPAQPAVNTAKPEDIMKLLPREVQESINHGLKLHAAQRQALVAKINGYKKDLYSENELNAMSTEQLEKISQLIPEAPAEEQPYNYTLFGVQPQVNAAGGDDSAPLLPTGFGGQK